MTRRRFDGRPLIWLSFAILVGVPSAQLTRMLRAQRLGLAETPPAPRVVRLEGAPMDASAGDPGAFRYEAVGPAKAPIVAAAVSPAGRLVTMLDESGEVTVWDAQERKQLSSFASKQLLPMKSYHPFHTPIAIEQPLGLGVQAALVSIGGNDGWVRVWQAATGDLILTMPHSAKDAPTDATRDAPLVDADISLEGGLVSVSRNGSLALWRYHQVVDSSLVWMSRTPRGNVRDIDISPDGRSIAVAADDALYLVNVVPPHNRTWAPIDTFGASPQRVRFNPGGGVLAAVWTDGEIRLYSAVSRDRLKVLRFGGSGPAPLLAFSPNGQLFAASDGNRIIQVWSTGFGAPVAVTAPHGPVRSMWFTADSRGIVVATQGDRYLRVLPLPETP
jgi:WD40 repeat protein